MQATYNRLIIEVESQFNDMLTYLSGVKLYIDTRFNPEEKVALTGVVHSVPINMRDVPGATGLSFGDVVEGDTVMLRYDVLSTTREQPDRDTTRYRNEVWIEGKQYWTADVEQVFAVQRGEDWVTLNDYVIMEPLVEHMGDFWGKESKIIRSAHLKTKQEDNIGIVISSTTHPIGTAVYFQQKLAQKYTLNGKPVFIIKERYLIGRSRKKSIQISENE
jgi:hypothetical protein